ncbi:hypothetical protein [Phycicoccus sonneratiae]|uniref:Uncharacterized protein n=1 Tax=Phycicoccus sonneratiae TaxID=2807628 RepID=A0ABS2CS99_9MICO|nr:hypothetical protein [Phycicoccus sonneraticus]MBM6402041.1 hypothetical protein [Phycicoccus sonneraticus]
MESRYARAYPELFDGLEPRMARYVDAVLGTTRDGGLWPEHEVAHVLDRAQGRISFGDYRAGRDPASS